MEFIYLFEGISVFFFAVVILDYFVIENDMVDSFVSDRFEIIVEVELVNLSDIG